MHRGHPWLRTLKTANCAERNDAESKKLAQRYKSRQINYRDARW